MAGKRFLILGVAFVGIRLVFGNPPIANPERDFVNTSDPVLANLGMLRTDEILRLDLDLSEDGKSTTFLAYHRGGSQAGLMWSAYIPVGDSYERIDGFQFRPDTYRAGKVKGLSDNGGLLAFYPGKGGGNLMRYEISNGTVSTHQLRTMDYQKPEDKKLFESLFKRKPDEPLPAQFFSSPPYKVLSATAIRQNIAAQSVGSDNNTASAQLNSTSADTSLAGASGHHSQERSEVKSNQRVLLVGGFVAIAIILGFFLFWRSRA